MSLRCIRGCLGLARGFECGRDRWDFGDLRMVGRFWG